MKKYCRILKELIRIRFQNLMMFRLGFFGPFFVDGSLFAVQLIVFHAVYENVYAIGSWGQGEMLLFIGTFSLLNALSMFLCFFGINTIPYKVRNGEMDLYLTKPVSPLFRLTFEQINPGSFPLVIMSVLIILYGASRTERSFTCEDVTAYLFWVTLMLFLYYELEVLIRSLSFFIISTVRLEQLEGACIEMCMKLPGIAFYGFYKFLFYCALPYAILATYPVQSLIGEMTAVQAAYGLFVLATFTGLTAFLWKTGIRHYNSASS